MNRKRIMALLLSTAIAANMMPPNLVFATSIDGVYNDAEGSVEGTEILQNGDFSNVNTEENTAAGWDINSGSATCTVSQGAVQFNITEQSADWQPYIKQEIQLEAGREYLISYDITSSANRQVTTGFDNGRLGLNHVQLTANEPEHVSYRYTATQDGGHPLMFYLGTWEGQTFPGEHTVTISNVSVLSLVSEKDKFLNAEGEETAAVEGNLLTDGNFAAGSQEAWADIRDVNAVFYFNKYQTAVDIKGNAADWQQCLRQNVNVTAGAEYTVSFDFYSTVERTVSVGLNSEKEYTSQTIPANQWTTVSYVSKVETDGQKEFSIFMGTDKNAHQVAIRNASIVKNKRELPDTENDTAPAEIASIKGTKPSEEFLIKNGNFKQGLAQWEPWCEEWMETWDVVKYTQTDDGMDVYIKNLGDGDGNHAWDVQLNQKIDLKAGKTYTLSMDVHSQKARSINLTLPDIDFVKPIAIQDDETRHVVINIPAQQADMSQTLFSIQMGKVDGDVLENTLHFSNIKIEENGYETRANLIQDGQFTSDTGAFNATGAIMEVMNQSLMVQAESGAVLERGGLNLEAGQKYKLSFVAGIKSADGKEITVTLPDGTTQKVTLTKEPTLYEFECTPQTDISDGKVSWNLGDGGRIFFDSIYLMADGFADAASIDINQHDIVDLENIEAPVLTEDANAIEGNNVVLTYEYDAAWTDAIMGIMIDGQLVDENLYTLANDGAKGTITLDSSLFSLGGQSQKVFKIAVMAEWYDDSMAYQSVYKTQVWTQTFEDKFDGNALDTSKWAYQNGTGAEYGVDGWGNNEQQYYSSDQITVEDGTLNILAEKKAQGGKAYSSGRIRTLADDGTKLFTQTYGRFEAKIKMPYLSSKDSQGLWPAFWMLPADEVYGGWPLSGEIDIMEARGREGDQVDGTIHFGKPWPDNANTGGIKYFDSEDAIGEYHIYGLEWTPDSITWLVDGEPYYTARNWYSQDANDPVRYAYPAPFDEDFYIILNLAVGGSFDENLLPSEAGIPAEMKVDYVRVYQGNFDTDNIVEPPMDKDAISDGAKTEFVDNAFEQIKTIHTTEDQDRTNWNFITMPSTQGDASISTVKDGDNTLAKIDIANGGTQPYAIQLTQMISLYQGRTYKLSFDAKADKNRTMNIKLGGSGIEDSGWGVYYSDSAHLTNDLTHYEYVFTMLSKSNELARLEFNLGLNTTSAYVGNVKLEETDTIDVDPDNRKSPLLDGNHIFNGNFDIGDETRLAYWHSDGGKVVKDATAGFVFTSDSAGSLSQKGLELLQNDTYKLTLDGASASGQSLNVKFVGADGTVYAEEKVSLAASMSAQSVEFTMPKGTTDRDGSLVISWTGGDIKLDNVKLTRETNNNVDFEEIQAYPLFNGDFELDKKGWGSYNADITVSNGTNMDGSTSKIAKVSGKNTANIWDALISNDGVDLNGGYTYILSFEAKSDSRSDETIETVLEDAYYTRSFDEKAVITNEWKEYSYEFRPTEDKENLALKFLVGQASQNYNLYLDNVEIKIKAAPMKPGTLDVPSPYNQLGKDITLDVNGAEEWLDSVVFYVDGEAVPADKVTIDKAKGKVTLAADVFTTSGGHSIVGKADGYAPTHALNMQIYSEDGNRILNGNFDNGLDGWGHWEMNGSGNVITENGYAKVHYEYGEMDNYNNYPAWAIQFLQEGIPLDKGTDYKLYFTAASTLGRPIKVTLDQGSGEQDNYIAITRDPKQYCVDFTATGDTLKLLYQLSTTGANASDNPSKGFDPHDIFLDNIILVPADVDVKAMTTTELGTKLPAPDVLAEIKDGRLAVTISPAQNTPDGVQYEIYVDGEQLAKQSELSFETACAADSAKVEVCAVYPSAFKSSDKTEVTAVKRAGTDEPGTDDPGTDKPGTDKPGTDKPGTDKPGTDKPGTDKPGTDNSGTGTGNSGTGNSGTGTGSQGTGSQGTGSQGTGNSGTGTGNSGTGNSGTGTGNQGKPANASGSAVKTGDTVPVAGLFASTAVSAAMALLLWFKKLRRKPDKKK